MNHKSVILTVTQVSRYIYGLFEQDDFLRMVQVKGEISNFARPGSGHIYFTLKDAGASIPCAFFRQKQRNLDFDLKDGMQVVVQGQVGVYEQQNRYQLYVNEVRREGAGDLFLRFEELKRTLEEKGYFDPAHKKPIPAYPTRIGIVTAETGAAIRDIQNIARRRNPYVSLYLYPTLVQGPGAKENIARGIACLDQMGLDLLIVGRGGGSMEDLWAFNEPEVAEAIYVCNTPVLSAVGHEVDFTIADFVADLRVPTPSAAAETAVFEYARYVQDQGQYAQMLESRLRSVLTANRQRAIQYGLRLERHKPDYILAQNRQKAVYYQEQLQMKMEKFLEQYRHRLSLQAQQLHLCSPLQKLGQGYGYLQSWNHVPITGIGQLLPGDKIQITLRDGTVAAQILEMEDKSDVN